MAVLSFESVSVSTTAVGLTPATYEDWSIRAIVTVEGGAVRFRSDGTNPTASVGHALEVGDSVTLRDHDEIQRTKFIRRDGTDATLMVSYEI